MNHSSFKKVSIAWDNSVSEIMLDSVVLISMSFVFCNVDPFILSPVLVFISMLSVSAIGLVRQKQYPLPLFFQNQGRL